MIKLKAYSYRNGTAVRFDYVYLGKRIQISIFINRAKHLGKQRNGILNIIKMANLAGRVHVAQGQREQ